MSKYPLIGLIAALALAAFGCNGAGHEMVKSEGVPAKSVTAPSDVSFQGVGGLELKGTMLMPSGQGPFPAVLLIPGSGPSDRDGNQMGLKIDLLKDIAEKLASDGIATLRFDKRAVAGTYMASFPADRSKWNDFFSFESFVGDVEAAYRFMKAQPGVDPAKLAILGHSEGGLFALSAAKDLKPAALVLCSTAGRDLGALIEEQLSQGFSAQFEDAATIKKITAEAHRVIEAIRTKSEVPGDVQKELAPLFPAYASKLLHSEFTIQPVALAADYPGPVLIVQGEKDIQVSPDRDAKKLLAAFKPGQATLDLIPDATHVYRKWVSAKDPGFSGAKIPEVPEKIGDWLANALK